MAQYIHQAQKRSRSWMLLIFGGLITLLVGLVVGNTDAGPLCGSPFIPDDDSTWMLDGIPGLANSTAAICEAKVGQQIVTTAVLIIVGIGIMLVGIIVRAITNSRPNTVSMAQTSQLKQSTQNSYTGSPQHVHPPQVKYPPQPKSHVMTVQPQMFQARPVTARLWSTAGIAAIVAGGLGLLFSAVASLPDLINGYGSVLLGVGGVLTSVGSLTAGIMVRSQRHQRRRAAPIALISATGLGLLAFLPEMNFGLGLMLFSTAVIVAIVAMAFGLVRDEREVLQAAQAA